MAAIGAEGFSLKRLRRYWRQYLADAYWQAIILGGFVCVGIYLSLLSNSDALANLSVSLMDGRPWMFLLVAWCAVRFVQLASHSFLPAKIRASRFPRRIWKASIDALTVAIGSFIGTVLALRAYGIRRPDDLWAIFLVLFIALFHLFAIAQGMYGHRFLNVSTIHRRWLGLAFAASLLAILAVSGNMTEREKSPHSCPVVKAQ
ncbi:hypothetical protein [Dyella silvae]|uniref:hypothetical protein n=1 Tax=Dyella silvae TaxID=2994424 RepID=UPI0022641583|nr:hypothetical protein [Dyella silvae]